MEGYPATTIEICFSGYSTALENLAWIQLLICRSSDHSQIATSRSSSVGHSHCHYCTRLVGYEPDLVRFKPVSKPQATLLNSKYVVEICMADVMLKRLKPFTSWAIVPTPCMFQYHRTLEHPATRTSIVPISVAAGSLSTPSMYACLLGKVTAPS